MEENKDSKKVINAARRRRRQRARQKERQVIEILTLQMEPKQEKSKEQVLAERKAKKAAKKQGGKKEDLSVETPAMSSPLATIKTEKVQSEMPKEAEKSREEVMAEREAKKLAKLAAKKKGSENDADKSTPPAPKQQQKVVEKKETRLSEQELARKNSDTVLAQKMEKLHIADSHEKSSDVDQKENKPQADDQNVDRSKPTSKAERRALQEAQRAAKAKAQAEKTKIPSSAVKKSIEAKTPKQDAPKAVTTTTSPPISQKSNALHKVRLFKHLYTEKCDLNVKVNSRLHPAIIRLGTQYANNTVVGCNSRCYAFLNAMQILVRDFVTPSEKVFSRALESEIQVAVEFLHKCRPLAVSVCNALKYIKTIVSQEISADSDEQKKERIIEKIETYAHEQIETAARSISLKVREKISDDDVILTFGYSSLIKRTLIESWMCGQKKFSVVVVDSRPDHEGQEMLEALAKEGICCTYVLINAISFIMPKVTKVLLGAHALLANGYVMSRVGTAQISMVANFYNVPVLVCCETHKFSERVQTDSFVYNEIGDPSALVINRNSMKPYEHLKEWESSSHLTPLNLRYDITPPELVTVVVTEVALLPCTSVQVILRVKPSE